MILLRLLTSAVLAYTFLVIASAIEPWRMKKQPTPQETMYGVAMWVLLAWMFYALLK